MELRERNITEQERYDLAKRRVKSIKGFYSHLLVYIVVNIMILIAKGQRFDSFDAILDWTNYTTAIFWGIGLLIHAMTVFLPNFIFGKNWEQKKIESLMEKYREGK